ncbi:MAG: tetratricopeptide repeat protein, partial [Planctomycetota bacterium]|nr:tetratricopeptide repeat protein [Planctomycetota bacterium]
EIDEKLWIPYQYRGKMYALESKWETAIKNYSIAIKIKPDYPTALAGRAYAYMKINQTQKARRDIEKAMASAPEKLDVIGTQAAIHLAQGKEDLCLKVLREGLAKDAELAKKPDYEIQDRAAPYNLMGNVLTRRGQLDQAIEAYSNALTANPVNTKSYASRGYCYAQQRKIDLALKDYNKAISIDPDFYRPYYNRATMNLSLKKYQESLADLNKVIALNPPILALGYAKRGEVKRELKDYQGALSDFKQALARDPNNYAVYGNRADVYIRLGELRKAINDFETFVEFMPKHPVAKMVKKQLPRLRASLKQKETQR